VVLDELLKPDEVLEWIELLVSLRDWLDVPVPELLVPLLF